MSALSLSETSQSSSAGSFSGTSINLGIEYPFYQMIQREYFFRTSVPVISTSGTGLYSGILGVNFYNKKLSAPYRMEEGASSLTIRPTFQYYWGLHSGAGAAIYTIGTAKKSDFGFMIGGQAGAVKHFKSPWGIKGEIFAAKGFGINTSYMTYSIGGAFIYDLE